jgi:hypothetical protein
MPYLVAVGCVLDVLATFFPWSEEVFSQYWFLPFSYPLPLGWGAQIIEGSLLVLIISVATRVAPLLGLTGLFLYTYRKSILSTLSLLVSTCLSFACFVVFYLLGWSPYLGAYMILLAGFLKLVGLILRNLEVELSVEDNNQRSIARSVNLERFERPTCLCFKIM